MILALDQGTTSSRALVVDRDGRVVASAQETVGQTYPQPGWVEQDAGAIWRTQLETAREALRRAGLAAGDIAAVGIANQRETTVVWDRASGGPVTPAIVWQDRRTAGACAALAAAGHEALVRERTGLVLDPYFSATKLAWILDHVPGGAPGPRAASSPPAPSTPSSPGGLTGGRLHVTDVSNASRTLLIDLPLGEWDDELLDAVRRAARRSCPRSAPAGGLRRDGRRAARPAIPIAAAWRATSRRRSSGRPASGRGDAKCTYGTGAFLLQNVGAEPPLPHGLLTTVAWRIGEADPLRPRGQRLRRRRSGAVAARRSWSSSRRPPTCEALAKPVKDSGEVCLRPGARGPRRAALETGGARPHPRPAPGHDAGHLARALARGHRLPDPRPRRSDGSDAGQTAPVLRVDGGASANDLLMQFQADLLGLPSSARACSRRPRWGRPSWPASPPASGPTPPRSRRSTARAGASRRIPRSNAAALRALAPGGRRRPAAGELTVAAAGVGPTLGGARGRMTSTGAHDHPRNGLSRPYEGNPSSVSATAGRPPSGSALSDEAPRGPRRAAPSSRADLWADGTR